MTILALEFSSDRRSVALARDGVVLAESVEETAGRGTKALGLIERALAEATLSRAAIELIAVGLGPGSYTGIRAALALAQGWQLATNVKLAGVNSATAIAGEAQRNQMFGRVNVVIDAQRGEFYLSQWELSAGARKEIAPLKIVAAAEIAARRAAGELCLGPEEAERRFPTATMVARLAMEGWAGLPLEPIYLRETTFVKAPAGRLI
jgi:tRNA threonylcarbamoyladenosine biosynthesis protein TsaB